MAPSPAASKPFDQGSARRARARLVEALQREAGLRGLLGAHVERRDVAFDDLVIAGAAAREALRHEGLEVFASGKPAS